MPNEGDRRAARRRIAARIPIRLNSSNTRIIVNTLGSTLRPENRRPRVPPEAQILPDYQQQLRPTRADNGYSSLECSICWEYMVSPVGCGNCSGRFCATCLAKSVASTQCCPVCRNQNVSAVADKQLRERLQETQVCCRFIGCSDIISAADVASHEASCSFAQVSCSYREWGCLWKGQRSDLGGHLETCQTHAVRHIIDRLLSAEAAQASLQLELQAVRRQSVQGHESRMFLWNPVDLCSFIFRALTSEPSRMRLQLAKLQFVLQLLPLGLFSVRTLVKLGESNPRGAMFFVLGLISAFVAARWTYWQAWLRNVAGLRSLIHTTRGPWLKAQLNLLALLLCTREQSSLTGNKEHFRFALLVVAILLFPAFLFSKLGAWLYRNKQVEQLVIFGTCLRVYGWSTTYSVLSMTSIFDRKLSLWGVCSFLCLLLTWEYRKGVSWTTPLFGLSCVLLLDRLLDEMLRLAEKAGRSLTNPWGTITAWSWIGVLVLIYTL